MVDDTSNPRPHTGAHSGHRTRVTVTAEYAHPSAARDAAAALADAGFGAAEVSLVPGADDNVLRAQRQSSPYKLERGEMPPANGAVLGFVVGLLGFGLLGLLMGSGMLNIFGKEAAQAVGPFWAAVIGGGVFGLALAFAGYIFNAPLPYPEPLDPAPGKPDPRTFVSVITTAEQEAAAGDALRRFDPNRVSVWHAANGDWLPSGQGA